MDEKPQYKTLKKYELLQLLFHFKSKGILKIEEIENWVNKKYNDPFDIVIWMKERKKDGR